MVIKNLNIIQEVVHKDVKQLCYELFTKVIFFMTLAIKSCSYIILGKVENLCDINNLSQFVSKNKRN